MTDPTDELIQGTVTWLQARVGKLTASRVGDALARTKTGWSTRRGDYLMELVAERLTGRASDHYVSPAMQWGTDNEPGACAAYEFMTDNATSQVGFVDHPSIPASGASPDRYVGDDGLVEFKCPTTRTHLETLLLGDVPAGNRPQVIWQLACTERKWCDWVSFDPRLPPDLQYFGVRVMRDDTEIAAMEMEVINFLAEVATMINRLARARP
jgi:putative phage-type endonuclease